MGDGSSIEWLRDEHGRAGASWPFIVGCRKKSEGCRHCYAERLSATRLSKTDKYQGLAVMKDRGPEWTGDARLWAPHLGWPMHWRRPRNIFPVDMGDLFYERVTDEEIAAGFGVMAACPQHTFILLTKRPARALSWFAWAKEQATGRFVGPALAEHAACHYRDAGDTATANLLFTAANRAQGRPWPLPNVWMGVSVEDQDSADQLLPVLAKIPAALRHVSVEPLLGSIGIWPHIDRLDWVIVGGESGPRARPCDVAWIRYVVEQCRRASLTPTPVFVKQLGAVVHTDGISQPGTHWPKGTRLEDIGGVFRVHLQNKKGSAVAEWPADLRIREMPHPKERSAC